MAKLFFTTLAKAMAIVCLVVTVANIAFAQEAKYETLNIPGTSDYVYMRRDTCNENTSLCPITEVTCVLPQGYTYKDTKIGVNSDGRDYYGTVVQTVTAPKITYVLSLTRIINIYDITRLHLKVVEQ